MRYIAIIVLLQIKVICLGQVSPDSIILDRTSRHIDAVDVRAKVKFTLPDYWSGDYSVMDSLQLYSGNSYMLSEQLNKIPGVQMQQGTLSTNRITIRGIGSRTPYETNRIKAYWGDIPLTTGDGVTAVEDIGFNDIASLRVLKGPSSSLYGAGLGGVIFIDPFVDGPQNKVSVTSEAGSFGTVSGLMDLNLNIKGGGLSMSLGSLKSSGYRENSNYNRYNASVKGEVRIGNSYLRFLYNFRYLNGQIPSSLNEGDFRDNPKAAGGTWGIIKGFEESNRHLLGIGIQFPLENNKLNSLTVFGTGNQLKEVRPFNELGEDMFSFGVRDKYSFVGENYKLEGGVEAMNEINTVSLYEVDGEAKGLLLSRNKYNRSYFNLFGLLELKKNAFAFQASVNLNKTNYKITHGEGLGDRYSYDIIVSPGIGVSYSFSESSSLLASLGHGFSAPSLLESQMPDGSFNSNIKPEQGVTCDLGYRHKGWNDRLLMELTIYYMKMNNLLVTKRESEEIFYGINAGETKHAGVEAGVNYHLVPLCNQKSATVSLSYFASGNRFECFVDDGVDFKGNHLPGIPNYNLSLGFNGQLKAFNLLLDYKRVGSQYLDDGNSLKYSGFDKLSGKVTFSLGWPGVKTILYMGVDNLFDTSYASMVLINAPSFGGSKPRYYYPGLPLNIYGGIKISL